MEIDFGFKVSGKSKYLQNTEKDFFDDLYVIFSENNIFQ